MKKSRIPSRSKGLVPVQDRVFDEVGSVAGGMIFVVGSNQLPVWPSSIERGIILGLLCGKLARRRISCTFYCTFPALFLHFFSTRTARQTIFFLREQRAAAATQFVHSSFKQHNGINTTTHHTLVSICLLLRNSLYLFTVFISGYWTHTLKQSFDTVDVLDRKRDGF